MPRPLEGVRVVELAGYVAGPGCARVLADLGAEVIKVEAFTGDPYRTNAPVYHMPDETDLEDPCFDVVAVNKKFLALDLKQEKGRAVFERLLQTADVLVTNTRPDSLQRLGYSYEQLKDTFPRLVFGHLVGYGPFGEKADAPGYDYTCYSARGGITASLCEKGGAPIVPGPAFGDLQAAMTLACGILAALNQRHASGKGDHVVVSLHGTAVYMMSLPHTASQYGYEMPFSRRSTFAPLLNTYRTRDDRWVQLCVPDFNGDYNRFVKAIDREDLVDDERYCNITRLCNNGLLEEFISLIDGQMAQRDLEEWVRIFREHDISFERCLTSREVLDDDEAWRNGFLRKVTYPTGNERIAINNPIWIEGAGGMAPFAPSRGVGSDTDEVLASLGYSPAQVEQLKQEGVALQHA